MKKSTLMNARLGGFALALALVQTMAAQNFTLTLQPNSVTLIPAKTSSFLVSLTPLAGFSSRVALSVGTLPSGVSASFSPNPVTLPGSSVLTLSATTNAALGSFTLNVTGAGGGITNTTSSSVTVNFGLLPLCTGGFQGTVTDIETGLPVAGAAVVAIFQKHLTVQSDASGQYIFTNLALAGDNVPTPYTMFTTRTDYWASPFVYPEAVCDVTNIINFQILLARYGSISGTVTDQGGHPLPGVTVGLSGASSVVTNTDANGFFQSGALMLGSSNSPIAYTVDGNTNGYWNGSTNTIVAANSNSVVHLVLIPICNATVTGRVVYGDTGLPATNISVQVLAGNGGGSTNTDANGDYAIPGIPLGQYNMPDVAEIAANVAGYNYGQTNVPVTNCLEIVIAPTLILQPLPRNNYGAVAGHVYDLETGLPLTNVFVIANSVQGAGNPVFTDTNGAYLVTNILIGTGGTTSSLAGVTVRLAGYYTGSTNFTLVAGQTVTQDVRILRMRFGEIIGVARDSATHLPVANVQVNVFGGAFPIAPLVTGPDGRYDTGPVQLNFPNAPTRLSSTATEIGYWTVQTNTTITADTTNVVDIEMIQICTGATIIGDVVSATTQLPITNATVIAGSQFAQTDTGGNFILTNVTVGNNNSPIQTTVMASAPGFNPQSHTVTIFCNATIITDFGVPQIAFGAIEGYVTNVLTGLPLTNVFVGSEFGGATSTDTNGYYRLDQAPLGANGASRTWTVTAIPTDFPPQTKSVVVSSNTVSRLDFGFGQAPTFLVVALTGAPNPVGIGSNLVYTVRLRNTAADAANVKLMDALPPTVSFVGAAITNLAGSSFGAPVFSNSVVSTASSNFASNATALLLVTVIPTTAGTLTNVATVSSDTPDIDVTGSNHTVEVTTTVSPAALLAADVGITSTGLPNPVLVSNQLTYMLVIQNAGPAGAPDVVVTDTLPASVSFVSASPSQGNVAQLPAGLRWDAGPLTNGATATATVLVLPLAVGSVTNTASVAINSISVIDRNPDNNTSTIVTTVNAPALTNVSVQLLGPIVFDPQTGLFEQSVGFNNLSGSPVAAVRLAVMGLPADVTLYNASGSTNGVPFVEYDLEIGPGASTAFLLEYYRSNRLDFASTNFSASVVTAVTPAAPLGTTVQLDREPFVSNGYLVIEFASVPGDTYVVQYSSDMQTWSTAVPPIVAAGTRVQWIDAGPPKTDSSPGAPGQRFYRVVQLP
jgi:uncharacterized repeat protein (TIGR01451 family)